MFPNPNDLRVGLARFLILLSIVGLISAQSPADEPRQRRVIIDADTANEIDDYFAITRGLVAPEFKVEGLSSATFGSPPAPGNITASQRANEELLAALGLSGTIPAALGAAIPMPDKQTPVDSQAARLIIKQAHAGSADDKLWVIATGQCTNLASALLLDPSIKDKVVFAFIDGDFNNDEWKPGIYNWRNDIHAVQVIFESDVEYYHMPAPSVSVQMQVAKEDAEQHLAGRGGIHRLLLNRWNTFNTRKHLWTMWDVALIEAILHPELATSQKAGAPLIHDLWRLEQSPNNARQVTVWTDIDEAKMLTDFWQALDRIPAKPETAQPLLQPTASPLIRSIPALDGNAWIGQDGMRVAWLSYKQVTSEMVDHLIDARVNTVFMKHGFHDLLDMESARWKGDLIVVDPRPHTLQRSLESSDRATRKGIHVYWLANYELTEMLPHLKRLGYQAAYAEGPARYLRNGPNKDAAPLDPVFWRGITGAHGDLIARLSTFHPIDGIIYDIEHYAEGMMYMQNAGFSDATFHKYRKSRKLGISPDTYPAGTRYNYLKNSGHLPDYYNFLEEEAYRQGRELANRWHAINPHLSFGIWPLLDNWYSQGFLRGLSGAVPSLGLSGVEYYHGAEQSKSMAEYFQSRSPNLLYLPGFYPPYAYSVDQLEQHVRLAIQQNKHYWMLGPGEELAQPIYRAALHDAHEFATAPLADDVSPTDLSYRVETDIDGPMLIVETARLPANEVPTLSLWSIFGGAPLCEKHPMLRVENNRYQARVRLLRRITNNSHLPQGFRSGVSYQFEPVPREFQYEDPHHTKLIDGRAYGYFGSTVAWSNDVEQSSVEFDLHRPYRVVSVEVAQPAKLDERTGGPTELEIEIARQPGEWQQQFPFKAQFPVTGKDYSEPDNPPGAPYDPRHGRAWLSWKADLKETSARWLRLNMKRIRNNSSISLGEVSIWALFDGPVQAELRSRGRRLPLNEGQSWMNRHAK